MIGTGRHGQANLASFSHHSHEKHPTKIYNECVKFSKGYVECTPNRVHDVGHAGYVK